MQRPAQVHMMRMAVCRTTSTSSFRGFIAAPKVLTTTNTGAALARSSALFTSLRFHGNGGNRDRPLKVKVVLPDGEEKNVVGYEGQSILDVCAEHGLPMEGACAGSCACSTCHVYLEDEAMDEFPEPTDEENDMIDLAFYPQPTSRLGCQLHLIKGKHDGLKVTMPKATRNMYVDGAKVVPH